MKRIVKLTTVLMLGALTIGAVPSQASAHSWGGGGGWGGGHGGWGGGGWGGWGGRGWGGFGLGVGLGLGYAAGYGYAPYYAPSYYYAPPVAYAPPAYYAPPSYYYSPNQAQPTPPTVAQSSAGGGQACDAGSYVCPMEVAVPAGARCYCPGNDGNRVYGSAK